MLSRTPVVFGLLVVLASAASACASDPASTPPITPGTSAAPREVNIIARDYAFAPPIIDLAPGETVVLHLVNGGVVVHEAVIGDVAVQDAWEEAEAAVANPPPGPTPAASVAPEVAGLRVVVDSGQRADVTWTMPADAAGSWFVGCHIPGHWALGMVVPIRFVGPDGRPPADG